MKGAVRIESINVVPAFWNLSVTGLPFWAARSGRGQDLILHEPLEGSCRGISTPHFELLFALEGANHDLAGWVGHARNFGVPPQFCLDVDSGGRFVVNCEAVSQEQC